MAGKEEFTPNGRAAGTQAEAYATDGEERDNAETRRRQRRRREEYRKKPKIPHAKPACGAPEKRSGEW
jgi:hypothetical protein